ncbi:hypothetical protein H2199_003143 [Coniosporium tulheliwenetii]|uniref:Uncharacterized protein n=1 Tax=Coniosporium tulheliwenetii TaxID=3383036 RepID=A0ACC2ZCF2_9PEZI|nr:hypothetical protein H2199_003143 [Cladosporium sp. JES 115]
MADAPNNNGANSERRRSSGATRFANLHAFKRDPANDNATQRRSSFADQAQKPGVLGQMWNKYAFDHSRKTSRRSLTAHTSWTRGPNSSK